jgi:peptidoglycan/xylan/chitin deacetylase (PgdA/CDA1 family)
MLAVVALAALLAAPAAAPAMPWAGGPRHVSRTALAMASGELQPGPRPRLLGSPEVDGRGVRGYVAFTFDDGPGPFTGRVLDVLAAHEVPAAFFFCGYQLAGKRAEAGGRTLRAIVAAGHLAGNHTHGHVSLASADRALAAREILANERALAPWLGAATRLFRPPYGKLSPAARALLADLGYTVVRWSIDVGDFGATDPAALRKAVVAEILAKEGGVILLHDVNPATVQALPGILADLERANCKRVAAGKAPILPVSLDYFAADATGAPLPLPPEASAWARRTRAHLDRVCQTR